VIVMAIPSINELIEVGKSVVSKAKELGAQEVEIYLSATNTFSLRIITDYITTRSGLDAGVGIRVVIGKKVGFASVSSLDYNKILGTVKKAIKIARTRPEDVEFRHLPDPRTPSSSGGIYDEDLLSVSTEELVSIAGKSVKEGLAMSPYIKKVDYSLNRTIGAFAVVNSRGIETGDNYTILSAWTTVKAEKNGDTVTGAEFVTSRKYVPDEVLGLSIKAGKRAEKMFNGKKLKKQIKGQLLLENYIVDNFFWPITFNISARNVQTKRSRFVGKLNEKVASSKLTIVDDGTLPEGIRTTKVDEEGVPTSKKSIIENGILKTFVYDSYTAYKEGKESTGNAFRRGYETLPSPSTSNLVIKETSGSKLNDLIAEIDKGVYIAGFTMGAHLTDPIKGTFSITSLNAFYVKNGSIEYPLKSVSASGNFFEMLNNIIKIGSDYRLSYFGKIPSLLVDEILFI